MGDLREHYERIGRTGEQLLADILAPLGPVEPGRRADLRWRGIEIEVKTARLRRYRDDERLGYQFCLRRTQHTDVGHADIVCLICLPHYPQAKEASFFWIPADHLPGRHLVIPSHAPKYQGRWSTYRERWDILEEIAAQQEALCASRN
jgi:hypothetical protein